MLNDLKERVFLANLDLVDRELVVQAFGNVSGIDDERKHVVIKPSGVPYVDLSPEAMVVVSLATGSVVEGKLRPSSDTPTHLALYRAFAEVGGVAHTHSPLATAWAQAGREVPPLGTTHADHFNGPIPCTRMMSNDEVAGDYEANTGAVIVERLAKLPPLDFPGVLVAAHGPFAWGRTPAEAVDASETVEYLCSLASATLALNPSAQAIPQSLLDRHFKRKHGPAATYGQPGSK